MPEVETAAGETVVVRDLETVRVMSDPLRMRMIELMSRGEWTVKRAAASLGVNQTRLYRHVAMLESHGLLRVTGTRLVSGIVEKRYAAPSRLAVEPRLFLGGSDAPEAVAGAVDGLVATAFGTVRREIGEAIQAGQIAISDDPARRRGMTMSLAEARLSGADADEFQQRLAALVAEFEARNANEAGETTADVAVGDAVAAGDATTAGPTDTDDVARYRLLIGFFRAADR